MFSSARLKKSCFDREGYLAATIQFLFVFLVFDLSPQDDKIWPFMGKIQPMGVVWPVKFTATSVTFVEIRRDDTVLTAGQMHSKAKILL
jgi:hypothetical protein